MISSPLPKTIRNSATASADAPGMRLATQDGSRADRRRSVSGESKSQLSMARTRPPTSVGATIPSKPRLIPASPPRKQRTDRNSKLTGMPGDGTAYGSRGAKNPTRKAVL